MCLQNCHLAVSWLPRLEQIVEKQVENPQSTHPDYRMWLTSMPCADFPVSVLQVGIKLSMQPPKGVRANMLRGLATDIALENFTFEKKVEGEEGEEGEGGEEGIDHGTAAYCKMLYALVFYHACVLERRKFGGIGWNIPYEWMASDLKTGVLQLQLYLPHVGTESTEGEEGEEGGEKRREKITKEAYWNSIPFDAIQTMMGEINYGGRVTDKWDLRPVADILGSLMCRALVAGGEGYSLVPGGDPGGGGGKEGLDLTGM